MTFESVKKAGIIGVMVVGFLGSMSGLMLGMDAHLTKKVDAKIEVVMQSLDMRYYTIRIEALQAQVERLEEDLRRSPTNAELRRKLERAYQKLDEAKRKLDSALEVN